MTFKKNIAVFASGGGSNFITIHKEMLSNNIPGNIQLLISNNPGCGAVTYANESGVNTAIINNKRYPSTEDLIHVMIRELEKVKTELIILAGYMKLIPNEVIKKYKNRILNIHPALLPSFGGKGYYGKLVHKAVIESGVKTTGVTVHIVDDIYDHGKIIQQVTVPVEKSDTAEILASRVLKAEHKLYPKVVKAFCEDRIEWVNNIPWII
jgi:formyltetrahydrofolate-dependent phosphoribosylglycinamide formyltransferase